MMRVRGLGELKFAVDYRSCEEEVFTHVVVALYDETREHTNLMLKLIPEKGLDLQRLDQILSRVDRIEWWSKEDAKKDRSLGFRFKGRIRDLESCLKKAGKLLEKAAKLLEKKQSKETAYSE